MTEIPEYLAKMYCEARDSRELIYSYPAWLQGEQLRQARAFAAGLELLTDVELLDGFRRTNAGVPPQGRVGTWIYNSVAGVLCGQTFPLWCELIRRHRPDPDLQMDEGL